jgi:O-6-methylguanine DNA methyltransferase
MIFSWPSEPQFTNTGKTKNNKGKNIPSFFLVALNFFGERKKKKKVSKNQKKEEMKVERKSSAFSAEFKRSSEKYKQALFYKEDPFTPKTAFPIWFPTPFQWKVYDFLLQIPIGNVVTYGHIARKIGCGSARAVGGALSKNPFWPTVPCHRVKKFIVFFFLFLLIDFVVFWPRRSTKS